jgi:uncharacterized protein YuzE
MGKKKMIKRLDYRHDKCKFCGSVKLKNSPMCRDCFNKKRKNKIPAVKVAKHIEKKKAKNIRHWITQQQKDAQKIFAPKVDYDKEFDILYITWFPQARCKYSMETESDFIFDLTDNDYIKGVEIMDFKKRFLKDAKPKPNKAKRRKH